jgi:hypothetical protein
MPRLLVLLLAFQAGACIGPLKFEVVDGVSHQHLSGVKLTVERRNPNGIEFAPPVDSYDPTGEDGRVTTGLLRADFQNSITFAKEGYMDTNGYIGVGASAVILRPGGYTTSSTRHKNLFTDLPGFEADPNRLIVVPMYAYDSPTVLKGQIEGPLTFRVVDGDSERPLSGVQLGPEMQRPIETSGDGKLSTGSFRADRTYEWYLSKPEYINVTIQSELGPAASRELLIANIDVFHPVPIDPTRQATITMYRIGSATAEKLRVEPRR